MPPIDRRVLAGLLVAVLIAGAVGVVAGAGGVAAQGGTPTNETVRHENPETVEESGELAAVEDWLAGRLSERLGNGTIAISQGRYERARSELGDEYDAQLDRYVDVTGETSGSDDDEAAEGFRRARNRSRSLANQSATFERTYAAYQRAAERGNESRARALARELLSLANGTNRTATRLEADLTEAAGRGDLNATAVRTAVRSTRDNVTERAREVEATVFVRTRLAADVTPSAVTFREPATVTGRLVDENGTAIGDRTVLVGHPNEAVAAETNASGWFEATYRPVRLRADAEGVPVRYVPEDGAAYLGNRTIAPAEVRSVEPVVTGPVHGSPARYGDRVSVGGTATVDGVGVGNVPVVATVGGTTIARTTTNGTGAFLVEAPLPASVPAGEQRVTVRIDQSGRAVAGASTSSTLAVEPTATGLSVDASLGINETLSASGRLRTVEGRDVEDQPIEVVVDGAVVATARTDGDGRFSVAVAPSVHGIDANGTATVRFYPRGNLLGSSESVAVGSPPAEAGGFQLSAPGWVVLLLAFGVLMAVGGLVRWWRLSPEGDAGDVGEQPSDPVDAAGPATADRAWREDVESLLAAGETDTAVTAAYGAARRRLSRELGLGGASTHWEVYTACAEDGLEERVEALGSLTETYEKARFAPASVSAGEARTAVERAATVLEG